MALGINTEEILNNLNDTNNEELIQNQKNPSMVKDILAAPFRGVEGAVQGVYNLADWATFDYLPDYDNRFLGRSETIAGSLVEGITQFIVPYGAISKGLSAAGKATKFAKPFMKVNKKGKEVLNWKGVLASEAATDFVAFDAQEERLSNLIQAFPSLQNPVTEYLAAEKDDAELEGRFKNTLEGLGITGAMVGTFGLALKAHKKFRGGDSKAAKDMLAATPDASKDPRNPLNTIGEGMDFKQIRTVPVEDYSPAIKASKNVYTKSKRLDKNQSIPVSVMEKELIKFGEKGTAEELRWMGFGDWAQSKGKDRVTQKEVDEFLEENQFKYSLVERSGNNAKPLYKGFTQEGGDNYREFILETNDDAVRLASENVNQHFNNKTLLHFRTTDRADADGSRVLFVEELQSDIIQKSRNNDFTEGNAIPLEESYIPSAMRMVMQLASKEGYDKVSWATPKQIAGLYDTRIDKIKLNSVTDDGLRSFDIEKDGRTTTQVIPDNELENFFGKKAAGELREMTVETVKRNYSVKQNSKSFMQYENQMVSAVNKVAKPFGGKVDMSKVDRQSQSTFVDKDLYSKTLDDDSFLSRSRHSRSFLSKVYDAISDPDIVGLSSYREWAESSFYNENVGRFVSTEDYIVNKFKRTIESKYDESVLVDNQVDLIEGFDGIGEFVQFQNPAQFKELYEDLDDILIDHFKRHKPETGTRFYGTSQEAFSIQLNDGMKKSVQEIRTWGLKTGDEAQLGGTIQDPALAQALNLPAIRYLNDKEVIGMERDFTGNNAGETNAKFALERLAENGSTPQVKKVAAGLLEMFGKDNDFLETTVRSIIEDSDSLGSFGFKDGKQNIELYTNRTQIEQGKVAGDDVFTEATLLHEITHAAQVRYIPRELSTISNLTGAEYLAKVDELIASSDTAPPLKRLLESYKTALDNAPDDFKGIMNNLNDATAFLDNSGMRSRIGEWYGLTNVDEFLAEAMSNTKFQNYLKSVKTGNTSLWDNIVTVLKDLFGIDAKGTLLGDTISNFADLVSKQNRKYSVESYTTPFVNPIKSRGSRINENRFFQKSGQEKEGIIVENRGGKIAVTGAVKAIEDVESAYDLGELLKTAEKQVLEEMEKTGQIGFYIDGSPEASQGLKKAVLYKQ